MILQPQIYSRSTKAHPLEVFLVIIMGGKIAGVAGMILAIPTYTVIKIIAREFADRMKLVKFLTSKM
jgi:predicted PurR-regulated permease PerM